VVIPRIALLDDEEPAVFTIRSGKAARQPVKLGYVDGEWAEVRAGLKVGDPVVTAGKVALREGSPVQVLNADRRVAEAKPTGRAQ
jgi:membrane fusion protein (multidrug efflux system)